MAEQLGRRLAGCKSQTSPAACSWKNCFLKSFRHLLPKELGCCAGTLCPITGNLLGKLLGWFPDAGIKKKINFLERASTLPKPRLGSVKLWLSQLGEEQL